LNSKGIPPSNPSELNTLEYSRWVDILRSWFWRFYDHLFRLVLYNLGWFLTCFVIGWVGWHGGLFGDVKSINLLGLYSIYMLESTASIGWAYLIFKIFIEGEGSFLDVWKGYKKYFLKAVGLSALSGFVLGLALYNIRFYFLLQNSHKLLDLMLAGFIFWFSIFWVSSMLYQWPILFFQNPTFLKIFYRSFLLVLGNGLVSLGILVFLVACFFLFWIAPFLLFFIGMVFFFSIQCVALEKQYLRYKITYRDKPLEPFLEILEYERKRGWREFLRPWENR
jgi:uncharacterized membrane protein YesL